MEEVTVVKLTEEELLREALAHVSEACSFLFEIETDPGRALAFMADNVIRYGEHILKGRDPRCSEEFYEVLDSSKTLSEMSKEEIADLIVDSDLSYKKAPYGNPNCS